jgi:hypothetical protein
VRKFLVLVSLMCVGVMFADLASARPRGFRASRVLSKPTKTQKYFYRGRTRASRRQHDDSPPPRHWKVAVPKRAVRAVLNRALAEVNGTAAAAEIAGSDAAHAAMAVSPGAPAEAGGTAASGQVMSGPSAGVQLSGGQPASGSATGRATTPAAVKAPAPAKPVRLVVLNPDPPRPPAASGPKLPHHFAVCYWDQAGHCVGR